MPAVPVPVISTHHVEFFRTLAAVAAAQPAFVLAPSDGAELDFGLGALGDTTPSAFRLIVAEPAAVGTLGLDCEHDGDIWRITGMSGTPLFERGWGPQVVFGGADAAVAELVPVLIGAASSPWVQVRAEDGSVPPALLRLPVVSPAGQVLFRLATAADALRGHGVPQGAEPPGRLDYAAAQLGFAAELVEAHTEEVVRDLVHLRNYEPDLATGSGSSLAARLASVLDAGADVFFEDAVLQWEGDHDCGPGWVDSMLAHVRLPLRRSLDSLGFDLAYQLDPAP